MKYIIKTMKAKNNKNLYIPIFKDESFDVLSDFLFSEMRNFKSSVLKTIEKSNKSSKKVGFVGNCVAFTIEDDVAIIEGTIDGANSDQRIIMKKSDFVELINRWLQDLRELKEQKIKT